MQSSLGVQLLLDGLHSTGRTMPVEGIMARGSLLMNLGYTAEVVMLVVVVEMRWS